jgi:hypothetical protein
VLQLTLALFFGHLIDMRVNMAAGFLAASGQNPYLAHDLSAVFHTWLFKDFTTIGYPPLWPLLLALIYKCVYAVAPGLLAYNLAIKLPIIAANVWLAFLVRSTLTKMGVSIRAARTAWIFMLFNPFILYATAAWGQIDSIVAALSLAAIILLDSGKYGRSALFLGLAIAFKPIALPLIPVVFIYLIPRSWRQAARYGLIFSMVVSFLCAGPFVVFGWDPAVIARNWNAHFITGGGMSFLTFLEFIPDASPLTGLWQLAGFLWVPALCLAIFFLREGIGGLEDLLKKSAALLLVFFLTRSWLSEPNIVVRPAKTAFACRVGPDSCVQYFQCLRGIAVFPRHTAHHGTTAQDRGGLSSGKADRAVGRGDGMACCRMGHRGGLYEKGAPFRHGCTTMKTRMGKAV